MKMNRTLWVLALWCLISQGICQKFADTADYDGNEQEIRPNRQGNYRTKRGREDLDSRRTGRFTIVEPSSESSERLSAKGDDVIAFSGKSEEGDSKRKRQADMDMGGDMMFEDEGMDGMGAGHGGASAVMDEDFLDVDGSEGHAIYQRSYGYGGHGGGGGGGGGHYGGYGGGYKKGYGGGYGGGYGKGYGEGYKKSYGGHGGYKKEYKGHESYGEYKMSDSGVYDRYGNSMKA